MKPNFMPLRESVEIFERDQVTKAIEACDGDRLQAANRLQISMATLYRKLGMSPNAATPRQVYVLHNPRAKAYKIGCSSSPSLRESTLQAQDPGIILIKKYKGQRIDESRLHAKFAGKHIRGEWFKLDKSDLKAIDDYFAIVNG